MLIIIPGWRHSAAEWNSVSTQLTSQHIEHVTLDLPGFGTVPNDEPLQTLADLSQWCLQEITALQKDSTTPLVLFGHSCGGRIAAQLVAQGLTVEKLILCGSPNLYRPSTKTKLIKNLVMVSSPFKGLVPESLRQKLRSDDYQAVLDDPLRDLYLDVVRDDQSDILSKITCPTTLLWGEHDDAAPLWIGQELAQRLSNSTLDIIPHAGHNLHYEKPQLLAAKIAQYVAQAN